MKKLLPILVLAVTFAVFSGGLSNDFLNWDDQAHYFANPDVIHFSLSNFFEPFRHLVNKIYIPLTTLSFALEYKFFGPDPLVSHLINLVLHLCNVWLVYAIARKMKLGQVAAFAAALLFGVHPMHVESVMWVTQRKDVLYSLFYLLAISYYLEYLRNNEPNRRSFSLLFGLLSLLAKPMALSLPLILILLDWFTGRKINKVTLIEKIPFFCIAILVGAVSYWSNARVPFVNILEAPLVWIWSFSFYIIKFFFPVFLSPLYYLPGPVSLVNPAYLLSIAVFAAAIACFALVPNRWLRFAMLFYFLSVFFLLRFDAAADKSIVADRFMYLPSLGICLAAGVLIGWVRRNLGNRTAGIMIYALFLPLAVQTYQQCSVWQNSLVLWNRVIEYYPNGARGYSYRANAYLSSGNYGPAMNDINHAIYLDKEEYSAHYQKGFIYFQMGRLQDALEAFNVCLGIKPDYVRALDGRGVVFAFLGRFPEAIADFSKALQIDPRDESALSNLARAKAEAGQEGG